jgi:drug/metabolite transporter (DMT)-like permease
MALLVVRGIDLLAVGAAVVATGMTLVYRGIIESQDSSDDSVAVGVQVVLLVGALLALAGAPTGLRHRLPVLLVASVLLGAIGVLGILTIGLPILAAAGLAFWAAARDLIAPRAPSAP